MAEYSIDILDVGHGNCAVIKAAGEVITIDAGPKGVLQEYLDQQNITKVNLVLLSHSDEDHIGGVIGLLGSLTYTIERIHLNSDGDKGSKIWDDLIYELTHRSKAGEVDFQINLTSDESYDFSFGEMTLDILGPSKYLAAKSPGSLDRNDRRIETNSISAVVEVKMNDQSVAIFAGDLDYVGLSNLMENIDSRATPVLVFPHHGSGRIEGGVENFVNDIIDQFQPANIVFSIGRRKLNNPSREVVSAIRAKNGEIRNLCTQLSTNCARQIPVGIPESLATPTYSRGQESNSCCAGTMSISQEGNFELLPTHQSHLEFIGKWIPHAICVED